jgi:hypothetical protein
LNTVKTKGFRNGLEKVSGRMSFSKPFEGFQENLQRMVLHGNHIKGFLHGYA